MTVVSQPEICHVISSINEYTGGTAGAVPTLAEVLSQQGVCSHLFTLDYQELGKQAATVGVKLHSYTASWSTRYMRGFHPKLSSALWRLASTELHLIHNHGLWMFPNVYARQAALGNHLPLVISPHGMLESWSLKYSRIKKLIAWFLYEHKNLSSATIFHATSVEEANSIRRLGFQQPIALISNGIHIPDSSKQISREVLTQLFPELVEKKWLLFLSRIHPKKGLDNLLLVWKKVANQFPDWHLIIAGPDLIGYQAKLELMTAKLGLKPKITFTGMLSGQYKASALSNADLFVLPTHSENFGNVIAESLAYGLPVVTTKGTPWQDLEHYKCGWWIENTRQTLTDALVEGMEMSSQERQVMGLKGRSLVETKYAWNTIAKQMASVYQWILGGGSPPSCVNVYSSERGKL